MTGYSMTTMLLSRIIPFCAIACAGGKTDLSDTAEAGNQSHSPADTETGEETEDDPPMEPVEVDYRLPGPHTTSTSSLTLSASCDSATQVIAPSTSGTWPRVLLSHGFMRGPAQMIGWAEHMASWGIEVVVPTLCHASIIDTDHAQNGTDLTQFNDAMGGGEVIYIGHSAGGLASLVAASEDDNAIGLIGLDLTDAEGLGLARAGGVSAPTLSVAGEANSCNSEGNGVDALRAVPDTTILRLAEADHCDFENETNALCTTFCSAPGSTFSDSDIHNTLLGLLTAATVSLAEQDPDAEAMWWTAGGTFYDGLSNTGAVIPL